MKLTKTIQDAFVRAVMADVPKIDYREKIRSVALKLAADRLPPKVRALWKDSELRGFVKTSQFYIHEAYYSLPGDYSNELKNEIAAATIDLDAAEDAQNVAAADLKGKIQAVARSVTTRKALADLLPEFAKYLPPDEAAALRTVPVVQNVVADFVKAGWPKDAKKAIREHA